MELKQICGIPACNAADVEPKFPEVDIFIIKQETIIAWKLPLVEQKQKKNRLKHSMANK